MNKKQLPYWVGVVTGSYDKHEVFQAEEEDVTPEKYPRYDYTVGPYPSKKEAAKRAAIEKNKTGTFTDPFCNNGEGR